MKQPSDTACVITTISHWSTHSIPYWADMFERVYVVLDKKTPIDEWVGIQLPRNVKVIGVDVDMCGVWNHYARKMLGYIAAYQDGFKYLFETDDDNYPLPDVEYVHKPAALEANGAWFNVFKHAALDELCPRGFPPYYSRECHTRLSSASHYRHASSVPAVTQWWCESDPDVWAFYRMRPDYLNYVKTHRQPSTWPVALCYEDYTFGATNTQMTLLTLNSDMMPLYYLPVTCLPRASDILRGWMMLAGMYERSLNLHYAGPGVTQVRNKHDLTMDMYEEIKLLDRFVWPVTTLGKLIAHGHCTEDENRVHSWYLSQLERSF